MNLQAVPAATPDRERCLSALASAAEEILGGAGAVPDSGVALQHAAALLVVVAGEPCTLHLAATKGAVEALLPSVLGRTTAPDETASLAAELVAELLNQVAGHWAGRLARQGIEATLDTPAAHERAVPSSDTVWIASILGHPLVLSLSSPGWNQP